MERTRLKIDGMTCNHCVKSVTKSLTAVPGVISADVNLAKAHAEVEHDGSIVPAMLIAAVHSEGYDAKAMV
ncbi:MAG: cation transporter [Armatimonadetes bacterium]|nr:cation transporter [Armatimonadota bacterium]